MAIWRSKLRYGASLQACQAVARSSFAAWRAFWQPPKACPHHTSRGSQKFFPRLSKVLLQYGFKASMSSTTRIVVTQYIRESARTVT